MVPDKLVHRLTRDRGLALQLKAKLDEEGDGSLQILDHDAGVIHPLDGHFFTS
jgi:hypothetical protein